MTRMRWKLLVCLPVLGVLFPGNLPAQEKMTFTIHQSVDLALSQNPEIKIAQKQVAKAEAAIGEAYAQILPSLAANVSFQRAWKIQSSTIPNFLKPMLAPVAPYIPEIEQMPDFVQISFGLRNTLTYGAVLQQPLYLGGAGIAGIQAASATKRMEQQNFEATRQSLIERTAGAFYGCLLAREVVRVQEEALAQAQANLEVVTKRHNVGMASGFDKMRSEVEVINLKPLVTTARNNYQSALTVFRTVIGVAKDTQVEIRGDLEFHEDELTQKSLAELELLVRRNRPELQAIAEQKYITQKYRKIARSNFLPKAFLQTDYSFLAMKNDLEFSGRDFSKGFTSLFTVQVPIFSGFQSREQYRKANIDYQIVLESEKQLGDAVAAEIEVTFNKFREARENYLSSRESIELAKEAMRLANMMYEEGANTQLDVLNTQLALTRTQLSYLTTLYEYERSRYALRKAIGILHSAL